MTAPEIFQQAKALGLELEAHGDRIRVYGESCPTDFAATLKAHKTELLDWLKRAPCPGWQAIPGDNLAVIPIEPQPTPANRERVIQYLRRQTGDRPGRLSAWLENRENLYFCSCGRNWDDWGPTYAAARDAAMWQLNRSEAEVWELLQGFAESAREIRKRKEIQ